MSLSLQAAVAFVPQYSLPPHYDARTTEFNQSLLAQHGMEFDPGLAGKGRNFTFRSLAEQALYAVPGALPTPGLLIVAYALPDPHALDSTISAHLNESLGGGAVSFAISGQGLGAPFTALRVAGAFARSGRCTSLALFILEQATFPYDLPFAQDTGLVDTSVLLSIGQSGSLDVASVRSASSPSGLPELISLPAGLAAGDVLIAAGPWLDPRQAERAGPKVHRVPPGSYCTSVWLELARHHRAWARDYQAVVVCDTDPVTGLSYAATLTRSA